MKSSLFPILLLVASVCSASLYGQITVLDEDFSSGVPPIGWTHVNVNGASSQGWIADGAGRAWHEDEFIGADSENRLVSATFSLTGLTQAYLHFDSELYWAAYLSINGSGNGTSHMQISTDGGLSWNNVWTEGATRDGTASPSVSLNSFVGQSNLQLGIYYFGNFAHEWWVDNILIDDTPVEILDTFIHPDTQHPYFLLGETDWVTAQTMAVSLGGSLATISDQAENSWVRAQTNNLDLWIGANDITTEGTFTWINGEPMSYSNWESGQGGISATEDFGLLKGSTGLWFDFGVNKIANAVVEISQPVLAYGGLVGGQIVTISCAGLKENSRVLFVFSVNGAGPTSTPFGVIDVDADMVTPLFWSASGRFEFSTVIPTALSGSTLYGQAIAINADSSGELSNASAEPIL